MLSLGGAERRFGGYLPVAVVIVGILVTLAPWEGWAEDRPRVSETYAGRVEARDWEYSGVYREVQYRRYTSRSVLLERFDDLKLYALDEDGDRLWDVLRICSASSSPHRACHTLELQEARFSVPAKRAVLFSPYDEKSVEYSVLILDDAVDKLRVKENLAERSLWSDEEDMLVRVFP